MQSISQQCGSWDWTFCPTCCISYLCPPRLHSLCSMEEDPRCRSFLLLVFRILLTLCLFPPIRREDAIGEKYQLSSSMNQPACSISHGPVVSGKPDESPRSDLFPASCQLLKVRSTLIQAGEIDCCSAESALLSSAATFFPRI